MDFTYSINSTHPWKTTFFEIFWEKKLLKTKTRVCARNMRDKCVKEKGGVSCVCVCVCVCVCEFLPLPPCDVLSVKRQTCSDSEGRLLFRLGRRQSTPHSASAATGESLQLTIITLTTDNPATHHSQSITAVTHTQLGFSNVVLRNYNYSKFFFCFRELQAITWRSRVKKPGLHNFWTKETKKMLWDNNQRLIRNITTSRKKGVLNMLSA